MNHIDTIIGMLKKRIEDEEHIVERERQYIECEMKRFNEFSGQHLVDYSQNIQRAQEHIKQYQEEIERLELLKAYSGK